MTGWFFTRIALAALFGVVVGAAIAVRMERNGKERNGGRSRVYWAYSYAGCIPLFILAVWLLNWAFYGADQAMDVLLALCFNTFLLLFVYYAILSLLMRHAGRIVSREEIMRDLWDSDAFVDDNTLTVNINRLRATLARIGVTDYLVTHRGQGYSV